MTDQNAKPCCCSGEDAKLNNKTHWIAGSIATPKGNVPVVKTVLTAADRLGGWVAGKFAGGSIG